MPSHRKRFVWGRNKTVESKRRLSIMFIHFMVIRRSIPVSGKLALENKIQYYQYLWNSFLAESCKTSQRSEVSYLAGLHSSEVDIGQVTGWVTTPPRGCNSGSPLLVFWISICLVYPMWVAVFFCKLPKITSSEYWAKHRISFPS